MLQKVSWRPFLVFRAPEAVGIAEFQNICTSNSISELLLVAKKLTQPPIKVYKDAEHFIFEMQTLQMKAINTHLIKLEFAVYIHYNFNDHHSSML